MNEHTKIEFNSGTYEGEVKYGLPHGFGISYRPDGSKIYEGEWNEGRYHGEGTLYTQEGDVEFEGR